MMHLYMFAVKDRATDSFGAPFFLQHRQQAIRQFSDEVNRAAEDNLMYRHPDDFDLYDLGHYDTERGVVVMDYDIPEVLVRAKDVSTTWKE